MVSGKYSVIMKTPLGAKKADIVLSEEGGQLSGNIVIKGKDNPFQGGNVHENSFSFSGELMSSVGKMSYTCEGNVDGDMFTATASAKKGTITMSGTRV